MEWLRWIFRGVNLALFLVLLFIIFTYKASDISPGAWEYKDLIAILLSVVSIIVTFIGIIVAVAAIWGFQTLKVMAEEKAVETSKVGSAAYLRSSDFKADLKIEIEEAIRQAAREAVQDALTAAVVRADDSPEHTTRDEQWRD